MNTLALCVAMTVWGADIGWRPLAEGGTEYVMRISPHVLETILQGGEIFSDIPVEAGDVWRIRITGPTKDIPVNQPPLGGWTSRLVASPHVGPPPPSSGDEPPGMSAPTSPPQAAASPPWAGGPPRELPTTGREEQDMARLTGAWIDEPEGGPSAKKVARADAQVNPAPSKKPWPALMLALVVAVGSTSGMCYFGWIAFGYRSRYQKLLAEMLQSGGAAAMLGRVQDSTAT